MSAVKRLMRDSLEKLKLDELLGGELKEAGYGGLSVTKTPLGTQITLHTMRPGRVIGKRGQNIRDISTRIESELGIQNPQIAVVEIEVPELDPYIMACRIGLAIERGVHYRRSLFWAARRIMVAGARGVEISAKGKLRSDRHSYEIVREGFVPKAGQPSRDNVRTATISVKVKLGMIGIKVWIVPPDAKFPDKIPTEALPSSPEFESKSDDLTGSAEPEVVSQEEEEVADTEAEGDKKPFG